MTIHKILLTLAVPSLLLVSSILYAETVRIPIGQGSEVWRGPTPVKGATKAQVEAEFGSPSSTQGPAGDPPIYFWEYSDFTVYFESDYVIHTVIKNRQK